MHIVLHIAAALVIAAVVWLGSLLTIGTLVNGRAWVWTQTREACGLARGRLRRRGVIGQPVLPSPDQPVTLTRLKGWR